jgi:hypothetical protein
MAFADGHLFQGTPGNEKRRHDLNEPILGQSPDEPGLQPADFGTPAAFPYFPQLSQAFLAEGLFDQRKSFVPFLGGGKDFFLKAWSGVQLP